MLQGDGTFAEKLMVFINWPSFLIVGGGTIGAVITSMPPEMLKDGMRSTRVALFNEPVDVKETIQLLAQLSNRARREGLLSLEEAAMTTEDDFLKRGLQMMADGHEAATIETVMYDEVLKIDERHRMATRFWDGLGMYGPAFGMIGTLIGLVKMLKNMDDPTTIGPAMAVALITTLYGSMLANIIALPMADKLKARSMLELQHKDLIMAGLLSILNGENPRFMVERLNCTLKPEHRLEEAA
jgi:chemotaxis protein MotA